MIGIFVTEEYDNTVEKAPLVYDTKRKRHVRKMPTEGYIASAVREYFPKLKDLKHTDKAFEKGRKVAMRAFQTYRKNQDDMEPGPKPSKKFRSSGTTKHFYYAM